MVALFAQGGVPSPYAAQQQQQQQHSASIAALVAGQASANTQSTQQPLQQPQQQVGQGQHALQQSGAVQQAQAAAAATAAVGAVGVQAPISSASDVGQMLAAAAAQGWTWDAARNDWIYSQPQVGAQVGGRPWAVMQPRSLSARLLHPQWCLLTSSSELFSVQETQNTAAFAAQYGQQQVAGQAQANQAQAQQQQLQQQQQQQQQQQAPPYPPSVSHHLT
jgi:serine/threonine-protein kinase LATS1/2